MNEELVSAIEEELAEYYPLVRFVGWTDGVIEYEDENGEYRAYSLFSMNQTMLKFVGPFLEWKGFPMVCVPVSNELIESDAEGTIPVIVDVVADSIADLLERVSE